MRPTRKGAETETGEGGENAFIIANNNKPSHGIANAVLHSP